jgi:hypothetical protein
LFILGENVKSKRLLLNDPDVAGHISQMENLIQALTSRVNTLESELAAQKQKSTSKKKYDGTNTM